jgi:hypothetical protein
VCGVLLCIISGGGINLAWKVLNHVCSRITNRMYWDDSDDVSVNWIEVGMSHHQ